MKPLADCRLYAFVDTAYLHGREPEVVCRELCVGGADLVQLRAKHESADWIRAAAEKLLPITTAAKVRLVINDHVDLARGLGAPVCHLGQEDFFDAGFTHIDQLRGAGLQPANPSEESTFSRQQAAIAGQPDNARQAASLPHIPEIGLSTHAPEQAQRAIAAGADYIAIGPVFPTGTKPEARPVTLDYVRWAAANVAIPWWAIGGITLENLDSVLEAGARRICVVSAILNAPDIAAACATFRRRLE